MPSPSDIALGDVARWCLRRVLVRLFDEPVSAALRSLSGVLRNSGMVRDGKGTRRRQFPLAVREQCWERAEKVPGRHPGRWRRDAVGNLVAKELNGCDGALCYTFDHIVPFSKGGNCNLENCQVLQTAANFRKADSVGMPKETLARASAKLHLSDRDMDAVEIGVYGNVWREGSADTPLFRLRKMPWPQDEQ